MDEIVPNKIPAALAKLSSISKVECRAVIDEFAYMMSSAKNVKPSSPSVKISGHSG